MSVPNFVLYLIAGILFSVIISPSLWNAVDTAFTCESMHDDVKEICFTQKRLLNAILFIGPPGLGLIFGLMKR